MIIALCGYMGSGKSLIGKNLAQTVNFEFIDLDQVIAQDQNLTIPEIFEQKGEITFRKMEIKVLNRCLKMAEDTVLALGGGTPCYGRNLDIIKETPDTTLVYINKDRHELTKYLFKVRHQRPLVRTIETKEKMDDYVRKHLFERQFYYLQADVNLKCSGKPLDEIVHQIIKRTPIER